MARIEKIAKHSVEIEIHEARSLVQQIRLIQQHFLERDQPLLELGKQLLFLKAPLLQAGTPEFTFLVADKSEPVAQRDQFLPVNVVQLERHAFDLIFDVPPENRLHSLPSPREQSQSEFAVDILRNHLGVLADLENDRFAIADNRHCIVAFPRQAPNQRTVAIGNIDNFELCSGEFQDAALDDAKRAPGKLNQLNHVARRCATICNL